VTVFPPQLATQTFEPKTASASDSVGTAIVREAAALADIETKGREVNAMTKAVRSDRLRTDKDGDMDGPPIWVNSTRPLFLL